MPNHVTNLFQVTGPQDEIEKFRKAVETTEKDRNGHDTFCFDFNGTVPMPEEVKNTESRSPVDKELKEKYERNEKKHGAKNWYDWAVKFWGTKWGAYDAQRPVEVDGGIQYTFNTAWSPGCEWMLATSEQFPRLTFTDYWINEGGGAGKYVVLEGEEIEDSKITDHEWKMMWVEDYKDEYEAIVNPSYEEFIKEFSKGLSLQFYELEREVLNRIKDKDLPLFVGAGWEYYEHEFEQRIRKIKETA